MTEHNSIDDQEGISPHISKSQQKRDLSKLRDMVQELINYTNEKVRSLGVEEITAAVLLARRTTRATVKKRQIQYITKLIYKSEPGVIARLTDLFDQKNVKKRYQKIALWREGLLKDDGETFSLIVADYPNINRQYLQQLIRKATIEKETGKNGGASKKLFHFLKELDAY